MTTFNERFRERFSREWWKGFGTTEDIDNLGIKGIESFVLSEARQSALEEVSQLFEGYFKGGILDGRNWVTWEFYKDRHGIDEHGQLGDSINGVTVYTPKYAQCFRTQTLAAIEGLIKKV